MHRLKFKVPTLAFIFILQSAIFNPKSAIIFAQCNSWTQKASMSGNGRRHSVAFSIDDKGYITTGFYNGSTKYKDLWEYDSNTNTWTQKADFAGLARSNAVGFAIGNKGYCGIGNDGFTQYYDFWEYDPLSNSWTQKADFYTSLNMAEVFTIGSKGYVIRGNLMAEYDPLLDTWTPKTSPGLGGRWGAATFAIGSKGYYGCGTDGSIYYKDFWEYDPNSDSWTQKSDFGGIGRQEPVGFSIGLKGYVGTGWAASPSQLKDFWEYDLTTDTWIQKTDFGGNARGAAVSFVIGSRGYVGTGNLYKDLWMYLPSGPVIDSINYLDVDCYGNNTGVINIFARGAGTLIYSIDSGLIYDSIGIFTGLSPGNYEVLVQDFNNCSDTNVSIIISQPQLLVVDSFVINDSLLCHGDTSGMIAIYATGGTGSLKYSIDSGLTFSNVSIFGGLGAGVYDMVIQDSNGCMTVDLINISEPPLISNSNSTNICLGDSILLYGTFQSSPGFYSDTLSAINGCDSIISTILIVNALPTVTFSGLDTIYCSTDAGVTMTGMPIGGTFSGTGISGNQFDPAVAGTGTHTITYFYTDGNGCTNSVSQDVTVSICTGINQSAISNHQSLIIYPNPSTGEFTIEYARMLKNTTIILFNKLGQKVLEFELETNRKTIDISDLPDGLYILQLQNDNGYYYQKVVKY